MSSTDWDKELQKIDKQLESLSDEALLPAKTPAPQAKGSAKKGSAAAAAPAGRQTTTLGVMFRLVLAVALGVAMVFWPYSARCGVGLFAYLGASAMVIVSGVWTSIWTWRHRSVQGHVLSLLLILWGLILGSQQVLPRVGYAKPDALHPSVWMCK
mgnify:CR=1 FL=1